LHGKRQAVEFTSVPDHQPFTVDGSEYRRPATIELGRAQSHEAHGPAGERLTLESGWPIGYVLMDLPAYLMWFVTIPLNPTQVFAPYAANRLLDRDAVHFGPGGE
jgi:hypothetical protein